MDFDASQVQFPYFKIDLTATQELPPTLQVEVDCNGMPKANRRGTRQNSVSTVQALNVLN